MDLGAISVIMDENIKIQREIVYHTVFRNNNEMKLDYIEI